MKEIGHWYRHTPSGSRRNMKKSVVFQLIQTHFSLASKDLSKYVKWGDSTKNVTGVHLNNFNTLLARLFYFPTASIAARAITPTMKNITT